MEREIFGYKCQKCGTLHYPFRMVCKNCRANGYFEFDTVPLPHAGKLLTFTFIHNLPAEFEVARLGLGIVELENGLRVTGQIQIDDPKLGMDVVGAIEVVKRDAYDNRYGFVFRAA
ncbi:MAG: OB-fold domain-containing protein [Actinobacteria bacterium]|nr:OB-fold domain-containing protein [Actinomycetota bacterium]